MHRFRRRASYYNTEAVDDDHAQRRFFYDRETQPGEYGDWQPEVITLVQTQKETSTKPNGIVDASVAKHNLTDGSTTGSSQSCTRWSVL